MTVQVHLADDPGFGEEQLAKMLWLVSYYEDHSDDYYGTGESLFMDTKRNVWVMGHGHCSCYGPTDESEHQPMEYSFDADPSVHAVRVDHPGQHELAEQAAAMVNRFDIDTPVEVIHDYLLENLTRPHEIA